MSLLKRDLILISHYGSGGSTWHPLIGYVSHEEPGPTREAVGIKKFEDISRMPCARHWPREAVGDGVGTQRR